VLVGALAPTNRRTAAREGKGKKDICLLFIVIYCYLLLFIVIYCYLLLFIVVIMLREEALLELKLRYYQLIQVLLLLLITSTTTTTIDGTRY
jgi:hypothetical protein